MAIIKMGSSSPLSLDLTTLPAASLPTVAGAITPSGSSSDAGFHLLFQGSMQAQGARGLTADAGKSLPQGGEVLPENGDRPKPVVTGEGSESMTGQDAAVSALAPDTVASVSDDGGSVPATTPPLTGRMAAEPPRSSAASPSSAAPGVMPQGDPLGGTAASAEGQAGSTAPTVMDAAVVAEADQTIGPVEQSGGQGSDEVSRAVINGPAAREQSGAATAETLATSSSPATASAELTVAAPAASAAPATADRSAETSTSGASSTPVQVVGTEAPVAAAPLAGPEPAATAAVEVATTTAPDAPVTVTAGETVRSEGVPIESVNVADGEHPGTTAAADAAVISGAQADTDAAARVVTVHPSAAPADGILPPAEDSPDVASPVRSTQAMQDMPVAGASRPNPPSASSEVTDLVGKDVASASVGSRPEGQRLATDALSARQESQAQAAQLQVSTDTGDSADSGQSSRQEGQSAAAAAAAPGRGHNATPATTAQPGSDFAQQLQQKLAEPRWGGQLGERAIMMAQHGPRTAHIQLDPPELGAMQIRVHLQGQDQVSVSFTSANPVVREALEQQLPRLREMFAEQGLNLQDSSVSDEARQQGSGQREQAEATGRTSAYGGTEGGETEALPTPLVAVGLVDYYA